MLFTPTPLAGAYLIELEEVSDERGFFARSWCHEEFTAKGLNSNLAQCNVSYNKASGTLRGMHYQKAPHAEVKLVRCTQGSIYDVIIDLRAESMTAHQWFGVELSAQNRNALYVPAGFAHGFITLRDNTEVLYQMSEFFHAESSAGLRWDESAFGIKWPIDPQVMSIRDRNYPDFV